MSFSMDNFLDRKEKQLIDVQNRIEEVKKSISMLEDIKSGNIPYKRGINNPTRNFDTAQDEEKITKKLAGVIVKRLDKQNLANRNVTMLANQDDMIGPKVMTCLEFILEHTEECHMAGNMEMVYLNLTKIDGCERILKNKRWWYILEAWGIVQFDEKDDNRVRIRDILLF